MTKKLITLPVLLLVMVLMAGCSKKESSFSENEDLKGQTSILDEDKTGEEPEKTSPETTEPPKETESEADLTTYKNDDLGFEFKHPKNWVEDTARSETNSVVFMNEDNPQPESREAVTVNDNTDNLALDQVVDNFIKERNYTEDMVTKDFSVKVGGESTTKIKTNDFGMIYYIFLHDNKIYMIDTQDNLFNENALKTFKFAS